MDPMSSANTEGSTNPDNDLTPAEIDSRNRLEAVAQHGLGTFVQVDKALAEIRDRRLYRDSHRSFETYVRERWGVHTANGDPAVRNKPCEALARACDETLSALAGDDLMQVEIRFAISKRPDPDTSGDGEVLDPSVVVVPIEDELRPKLRWLLAQATGTVGEVAHQLESCAADVDDHARAQLRDDVLALDCELAVVRALLAELIDWDSELARLLGNELPPPGIDTDLEDHE